MDFHTRPPRIVFGACRGLRTRAPENTLPAFALALGAGADFLRCDVRTAADGTAVVVHDATLDRTTNVQKVFPGRDSHVSSFTAQELRRLDAGSWFVETDPFATIASGLVTPAEARRLRGLKIPLLDEVLAFVKDAGWTVDLELQVGEEETNGPHAVQGCAEIPLHVESPEERQAAQDLGQLAASRVAALGMEESVLISSTSATCLRAAHEAAPAIALGLSVVDLRPFDPGRLCRDAHACCYIATTQVLTGCVVNCLTHHGIPVYVWPVDEVAPALRYCMQGVAGFIANDPAILAKAFPNRPLA